MNLEKKRILIVTRAFYPQRSPRSFRATELAKEFSRMGHQVTVLLPKTKTSLVDFSKTYEIQFKYFGPLEWKSFGKSKIKWIGDWKRKFGRFLFLMFEYPNIEILFKLKPALKEEKNYDLLISIAVPHEIHWSIAQVRSHSNPIAKKWVADCGDPFMGNILESIKPPFYFKYLEKLFCERADIISVPAKGSIDAYYPEYHHKIKVIPQGFNFEDVKLNKNNITYKKPTFAYAGGVAPTGIRSLNKFIQTLLNSERDFEFHVYSGSGKTVLGTLAKRHPGKLILHDPVDRNELLYRLSEMDFLVNLDNGTALNTPSKLIDYGLTQRPILNINPLDPDANLVKEFLEGDFSKAYLVSNLEQFNIKNIARSFLQC